MPIDRPDDPTPCSYRDADPYVAHLHLPGVRRRAKWIEGDDKAYHETFAVALEADSSATEACLALEHDRDLLALSQNQRRALEDTVYALNRLILEIQCDMLRIPPLGKSGTQHLVAYLLLWRQIGAQCFAILRLPGVLKVESRPARLNLWRPSVRSLEDVRLRYANVWAQNAFR